MYFDHVSSVHRRWPCIISDYAYVEYAYTEYVPSVVQQLPADTRSNNNVISTSKRRHDVVLT